MGEQLEGGVVDDGEVDYELRDLHCGYMLFPPESTAACCAVVVVVCGGGGLDGKVILTRDRTPNWRIIGKAVRGGEGRTYT